MEGAIIREAETEDAAGVERIYVDSWRTTYRGIVPDAFLDRMSYEVSEDRWIKRLGEQNRRAIFFVAELPKNGGVVGFASGGFRREEAYPDYDGELYTLYLLREHQGGGLDRRLLGVVAGKLPEVGCRSMLAWVMAENRSARRFYGEGAGGKLLGRNTFEVSGKDIEEVAYGWDDVRGLMKALA